MAETIAGRRTPAALFHVVNMALNVVSAEPTLPGRNARPSPSSSRRWPAATTYVGLLADRRVWQHGQAALSLGTAIAISGAAASPNQGYHSSPLVGLLMTLFNVRLGWWLGNPASRRRGVTRAGPRWGIVQIVKELFG